jgi:hypothetical protein
MARVAQRSAPAPVPPSREVALEPWLRAVAHLHARGLAPVVPPRVARDLRDLYGLRVAASTEPRWRRAA